MCRYIKLNVISIKQFELYIYTHSNLLYSYVIYVDGEICKINKKLESN